jgi:glycosyltransferase involved in cell wall biosynthesis
MEIWAHTLVKNEARWLWYSVMSVINYVDKLLLWDTGSTDDSIKIERELKKRFPDKIILKNHPITTKEEFTAVRQNMLDETFSEWFLVIDGDEIWRNESISSVCDFIRNKNKDCESVVVPTINLVGDIFHYQDNSGGNYKFGDLKGHYNLRAVKRNIPGLHSEGVHGVWGWADGNNKMLQERNSFKFLDAPYLHATFLQRGNKTKSDNEVIKRSKKYKYEIGKSFPLDYLFPEVFFIDRPVWIESPWTTMTGSYKLRSAFETPLRKLKRSFLKAKVGY